MNFWSFYHDQLTELGKIIHVAAATAVLLSSISMIVYYFDAESGRKNNLSKIENDLSHEILSLHPLFGWHFVAFNWTELFWNVFFRVQAKVSELYTIDVSSIDIDVVKLKFIVAIHYGIRYWNAQNCTLSLSFAFPFEQIKCIHFIEYMNKNIHQWMKCYIFFLGKL